jgi:hypothetical protein
MKRLDAASFDDFIDVMNPHLVPYNKPDQDSSHGAPGSPFYCVPSQGGWTKTVTPLSPALHGYRPTQLVMNRRCSK